MSRLNWDGNFVNTFNECREGVMSVEKIIKREGGGKVKITVSIYTNRIFGKFAYETDVQICEKGKRSWFGVYSTDTYVFRRMSTEDKVIFIKMEQLKHVTEDEIYQAKLELWNSIKPQESA